MRGEIATKLKSSGLWGWCIALAVSYYFAALLGFGFRFPNSQISIIWPPNAVLLSALILTPRNKWWAVLATTALAHAAALGQVVPGWRLIWQIAINSVFATATAELMRRIGRFPVHLGDRRQVVSYIAISFLSPMIFALVAPAFVLSVFHLEPNTGLSAVLLRAMLSNATALLLLAPVVLLWANANVRQAAEWPARRFLEAAVLTVLVLTIGLLAFDAGPEVARFPALLLWTFPPLLWAAVRFGPIGASTSLLGVGLLSIWGTARHLGPFALTTTSDQVLSLQLFWVALCIPVMLLASAIREREHVEAALAEQRNELAHLTRVTTVGALSGTLAHELNQPLAAILANTHAALHLLATQPEDLRQLREILEDITREDRQAASIIERLRSFLKQGKSSFETLTLETVVRDALELGRSTIEMSGVDVETQVIGGVLRVRGDPVQLLQVLMNLIVNACDAMTGVPSSDRHLRLRVACIDENRVEVQIADSGTGLPAGWENRLFEPFFTTKTKGLGLGLAICRTIATGHGGQLWAANNPEGGATFHLVLPIVEVQSGLGRGAS